MTRKYHNYGSQTNPWHHEDTTLEHGQTKTHTQKQEYNHSTATFGHLILMLLKYMHCLACMEASYLVIVSSMEQI